MEKEASNKRLVKNTLFLYVRMIVLMLVALYTSRIVLAELGVEDFGIYNVVGGVVAMFSILSGSLTSAISRFLTFNLGKGNKEKLANTFSTAVNIQLLLGMAILLVAELIGVWFINYKMNIPNSKLIGANWAFQCSMITFVLQLLSVPYNASIIAHERMSAFAYISIIEAILKLAIAFLIPLFLSKLIGYSVMIMLVAILIRFIYIVYCRMNFEECKYHFYFDKKLFKEIFSFAGWNFIGASSSTLRDQGGNILLNMFFGPTINAARGITFQVNSAITSFVNNFVTALNPQITKSYAIQDYKYMKSLVIKGSKFSFFLLLILSLPVFIEVDYILNLWLKEVPEYTNLFIRLIILFSLSESISMTLITAVLATGKIKKYQILVGGLQSLNFPLTYVFFKLGFPSYSIFIIAIIISQFCLFMRIILLREMLNISMREFIQNVYLRCIVVSCSSLLIVLLVKNILVFNQPYSFVFMSLLSILVSVIFIYTIGCTVIEREMVNKSLKKLIHRIK